MKVSGFTFVKNAVKYGYPVTASIRSILPVVDEMIVSLGDSDDETNKLIESIKDDKIKLVHSVWDNSLREGGKVLAVETNKAMDATAAGSDWLFYIQADEVLHEQYYPVMLAAMRRYLDDKRVEGLLFNYLHFYGSYKYVADSRTWYSKEIRIIRNNKNIRSYLDAQGFRLEGRKLNVKQIDAYIYHYGWVRNPLTMQQKNIDFGKLWAGVQSEEELRKQVEKKRDQFDYSTIDSVTLFAGKHPQVMQELVNKEDWQSDIDIKKKNFKNIKHRVLYFISKKFGWRPFEYQNYKRI